MGKGKSREEEIWEWGNRRRRRGRRGEEDQGEENSEKREVKKTGEVGEEGSQEGGNQGKGKGPARGCAEAAAKPSPASVASPPATTALVAAPTLKDFPQRGAFYATALHGALFCIRKCISAAPHVPALVSSASVAASWRWSFS